MARPSIDLRDHEKFEKEMALMWRAIKELAIEAGVSNQDILDREDPAKTCAGIEARMSQIEARERKGGLRLVWSRD